jgi:hypothetical protein
LVSESSDFDLTAKEMSSNKHLEKPQSSEMIP